jgi:hypothetical protein
MYKIYNIKEVSTLYVSIITGYFTFYIIFYILYSTMLYQSRNINEIS